MNDAKIVLNTMTWFKAGAHDRIFNGMLAKAVVVTDDSTYLRREFTDGRELVMFRRQELGTLPERVFDLFGHLERAQEIADCGYAAARDGPYVEKPCGVSEGVLSDLTNAHGRRWER